MTLSKTLKQKVLVTIAMSAICMFSNNTLAAEINETPTHDATYNDTVVLNHEWQLHENEYQGANDRTFKFNKGLTVDTKTGGTRNAIFLMITWTLILN